MLLTILRNGPLIVSGVIFGVGMSLITNVLSYDWECAATYSLVVPVLFSLLAFILWLFISPENVKDEDNNKPKILLFAIWFIFFLSTAAALGMTFRNFGRYSDRHCYSDSPGISSVFSTVLIPLSGSILWWYRRDEDDDDDDDDW
ncbi:hypothetical protein AGDE_02113 [Angomonas deanei]|uniref:Transmembrane protein n=1 Tax=Angomonas deanei TaxID=59799 RepID=A0A7G2CGY1_9TRYP|nr:hypothetical protein AGDE_02113 [Angomonas deanei]CAD2218307.1 Uncharacterised protein family (UPF0220), putative [Angomonas deanei]|eukprot:EPY41810.1 hypothetical protein AGDE_02113 [Angomonas deanei]